MLLSKAQRATLKASIDVDPTFGPLANTNANADLIVAAYNSLAVPDWIVWKSLLTEHQIVEQTSSANTVWSWTDYINRSQAERDAWVRMFNGTFSINPSIAQVRQGIADIFSGPSGANQRAHLLAMGKRKATRLEKLFATGLGTDAAPSNLVVEGNLTQDDVTAARDGA
jgi:hypothetical protein